MRINCKLTSKVCLYKYSQTPLPLPDSIYFLFPQPLLNTRRGFLSMVHLELMNPQTGTLFLDKFASLIFGKIRAPR